MRLAMRREIRTRTTHTATATRAARYHGPPSRTVSAAAPITNATVIGETIARNTVGSRRRAIAGEASSRSEYACAA